jgi:membrane protein required for colicin V production
MILDLIVVVLIALAIFKGLRRGLIVGIFSLVAIIIGLAAAIKLSSIVAGKLKDSIKVSDQWLPIISFAVVFIITLLLVHLGAKFIEKMVEAVMLGWVNRIGGAILYLAMYLIIFSVILFYAEQVNIVKEETKQKSLTYSYIQPIGPKAINGFGKVLPFFRNMFEDLQQFFGEVAEREETEKLPER